MLHGAAEETPTPAAPATTAAAASSTASNTPLENDATSDTSPTQAPSPPPPPPQPTSPETRERIARFNERNSGRRRSPWQVIEDAPLLLRRLWADLRRGDTQVFGELIRRGVQLQLFVVALYILSPVRVWAGFALCASSSVIAGAGGEGGGGKSEGLCSSDDFVQERVCALGVRAVAIT